MTIFILCLKQIVLILFIIKEIFIQHEVLGKLILNPSKTEMKVETIKNSTVYAITVKTNNFAWKLLCLEYM